MCLRKWLAGEGTLRLTRLTRASSRQSRSSRAVLAHGPRQPFLQLKPTLGEQEVSKIR